jgi:salicylate synthase
MANTLRYHVARAPLFHEARAQRYHQTRALDAVLRLARETPLDDFVLYEQEGVWHYAGGTAGSIVVNSREVLVEWDGKHHRMPWSGNPLPMVSGALAEFPADASRQPWNAYGWATFELAYALHGLPVPDSGLPLLRLVIPHTEAIIDATGTLVRSVSRDTARFCLDLLEHSTATSASRTEPADTRAGRDGYCAAVEAAVADIRAGKLEKVIVSRRLPAGRPLDMLATYRAGRLANTPARSFLLRTAGLEAAGFSPETVVEVDRARRAVTQPLAGTRAHGRGTGEDIRLTAELYSDPKEVYEHAISMRASWLELGTVCAPGTVRVDEPMAIRHRGSVQHLGSVVSGRLATGRTALDALAAVFPAVTASGIPKAAACASIARLEPEARGLYAGSVLRLGSDGDLDAALVLRSVFQSGGEAWLQAGAGIVGASRPEREFEETMEKLASVAPYIVPAENTPAENTPAERRADGHPARQTVPAPVAR